MNLAARVAESIAHTVMFKSLVVLNMKHAGNSAGAAAGEMRDDPELHEARTTLNQKTGLLGDLGKDFHLR